MEVYGNRHVVRSKQKFQVKCQKLGYFYKTEYPNYEKNNLLFSCRCNCRFRIYFLRKQ